jgi:hypothetical protein
MNEKYHYDLAVRLVNGQKFVVFRRTVGSLSIEQTLQCSEGPVVLRIEARPEHFRFSIEQKSSEVIFMGSGETHLLSTETTGGFTGVMLAMYAFGDNETTPALFDWFDYEVIDRSSSGGWSDLKLNKLFECRRNLSWGAHVYLNKGGIKRDIVWFLMLIVLSLAGHKLSLYAFRNPYLGNNSY